MLSSARIQMDGLYGELCLSKQRQDWSLDQKVPRNLTILNPPRSTTLMARQDQREKGSAQRDESKQLREQEGPEHP